MDVSSPAPLPAETAPGLPTGTCVLIANPISGRGRGDEALHVVEAILREAGAEVEVRRTTGQDEAIRFAQAAAEQGAASVVAIGGDGTLHEVLNGLFEADVDQRPVLGLVPVGTGNDYARMLGVPGREPAQAGRILLEGTARWVDVGRMEGGDRGPEHFCNNIGLAFMGAANASFDRIRGLPGRLSYVVGGTWTYLRYKPDLLTVTVDQVSVQGRFWVVHVGLGRYCGGGVCLTPDSRLDHGRFDVCVVANRSKIRGLAEWPRIAKGERLEDMTVLFGKRVRVQGPRNHLLHVDGETRSVPTGVLDVTLIRRALRVMHAPGR